MRTTVTISIDHETLADLDAFGARMAKKRGAAIRELLNIAANAEEGHRWALEQLKGDIARAERPLPGELNDRHRLPNGKTLPPGVQRGARGLGRDPEAPRALQPGERVVDPFTEEES